MRGRESKRSKRPEDDLALAGAEKKLAEQDFQRLSKLITSNATSQQELDAAREALEAASANVVVRQQELELLEAGTREEELREAAARVEEARQAWQLMEHGYRSEEIEQAKASRDAAQAALAAIRRQKEELSIKSPIDGTIEALDLQPGDMVAPGAPVLSMLDRNKLWVRAYIPQNRVGVQVGDRVRLTVDSLSGGTLRGRRDVCGPTSRIHSQQRADPRGAIQASLSHQGRDSRSNAICCDRE